MKKRDIIYGVGLLSVIGFSGLLVYLAQQSIPVRAEKQLKATEKEELTSKIYDKNGKLIYSVGETSK